MASHPPLWLILIAFLCLLTPLVFFHELGHYIMARLFKIPAETFSIGFGREIAGWTDRRGTRWRISWLPLGGYVKFVGDMTPVSDTADLENIPPELRARAFQVRPVWQRFLVVVAGPIANFILAIVIYSAFFSLVGTPRNNVVGEIVPHSAAAGAGLQPGDHIISVAGRDTPTFEDIASVVLLRANETVPMQIERNGATRDVTVTLGATEVPAPSGRKMRAGVLGVKSTVEVGGPVPLYRAMPMALGETEHWISSIIDGFGQLFRGRISADTLGGPVTIAKVAGQSAQFGLLPFIGFLAVLSINLGFINLLPVPPMDGGHLFLYIIEAVRRRPVSLVIMDWIARGGFALILTLMIFVTGNDLGLWSKLQRLIG